MGILQDVVGDAKQSLIGGVKNSLPNALLDSVFGEDINRYLRDGRLAPTNLGLYHAYLETNFPRLKFQYYVKINFNPLLKQSHIQNYFTDADLPLITPLVKSINMPSFDIATTEVNQYNKKRLSQSKIMFNDINMTMYDVADGKTLRFWEMYYEYYFRDGLNVAGGVGSGQTGQQTLQGSFGSGTNGKLSGNLSRDINKKQFQDDIIEDTFNNEFGYNIESVRDQRYLIDSIEIYQVHAGAFSKVSLMHPRITKFDHDTLSFDQSQVVELKFTIAYEDAVYHNFFTPFDKVDIEVFDRSDFKELNGQPQNTGVTIPKRAPVLAPTNVSTTSGFWGNLEKTVENSISNIPNIISQGISSAIFTGKVDFKTPSKQFGYDLGSGVTKSSVGSVFSSNPKSSDSGYKP